MITKDNLQLLVVLIAVVWSIHRMIKGRRHVNYCRLIIDMTNSYHQHIGRGNKIGMYILTLTTVGVVYKVPLTSHHDRLMLIKNISNPNFMRYKGTPECLEASENSMTVLIELHNLEERFLRLIDEELNSITGTVCAAGDFMIKYVSFLRNEIKQGRFDPWDETKQ